LVQLPASLAVPFTSDSTLVQTFVEKPLDATGFGFTSHDGKQQIFEEFSLPIAAAINTITWYGLFSEGTVANDQSSGNFDIFFFSNSSDLDYLAQFPTPDGKLTQGLPDGPALFGATGLGATGVGTGQSDPLHGGDIKRWTIALPTLFLTPDEYFVSIRASSSEPDFFLWSHSKSGADGYAIQGSISPLNEPLFGVSSEIFDTQAFSLGLKIPESGPGVAAFLTVIGLLLIAASQPRGARV